MKLTKAIWALLPADTQKLFTQVGDTEEYDNGEENAAAIKTARDRERDAAKALRDTLKAVETERDELQNRIDTGADKGKGDIEALTKAWTAKLDKATKEHTAAADGLKAQVRKLTVGQEARKLASEMATDEGVELLERFILDRLDVDLDGDMPTIKVLDGTGKPSASTIDELKKEFLADKRFSGILTGSKASGGGAGGSKPGSGAFKLDDYKNADGSTNWGKVNLDNQATPGVLKQVTDALNIVVPGADEPAPTI